MKTNKTTQSPGGKSAKIILLLTLLLFVVLLLTALVWFPRTGILPVFKSKWIVFTAVSNLISFFPAFLCSIILFSLALFPEFLSKSSRSFSSYAALFIILMVIFTGLRELGQPKFQKQLNDIRYLTKSGEELIQSAFEAEQANDILRAYQNLQRYKEIDPNNVTINKEFDRITKEYAAERTKRQEEREMFDNSGNLSETQTAESLVKRAENAISRKEYQSAYYYATIAKQLGSSEAEELQKQAWGKISSIIPEDELEKNRILFTQKSEGKTALSYGNTIEAYYLFSELHSAYPGDSEIEKYLEDAKEQLQHKAFFLEEVTQALSYPGFSDIFFIEKKGEDEIQLFFAENGVIAREGIFFQNIEILTFSTSEDLVREHLYAPYGKGIGIDLLMRCIHKTDDEIQYHPRFLVSSSDKTPPDSITVPIDPQEFQHFSRRQHQTDLLSLGELMLLRTLWPRHGYRKEPIYIEILMRVMYPFSFLVFSFFSLAVGIRTKHDTQKFSFIGIFLIPALPFLLYYIIQFFYYINRVFLTFIYSWLGFLMALVVLFITQGGLLMFSIGQGLKRTQEEK